MYSHLKRGCFEIQQGFSSTPLLACLYVGCIRITGHTFILFYCIQTMVCGTNFCSGYRINQLFSIHIELLLIHIAGLCRHWTPQHDDQHFILCPSLWHNSLASALIEFCAEVGLSTECIHSHTGAHFSNCIAKVHVM